jgi:hypothetical protein
MRRALILSIVLVTMTSAAPMNAATLVIQNADAPGKGFNDPTPATPVGGNPGTTLGEQRLNVFRYAAEIWGKLLESDVQIVIRATFSPIDDRDPCTSTSAILGAAGPADSLANFPGAPSPNVFYPVALANKLARQDLRPGEPDIDAFFNSLVDNATCLGSTDWYYGLDTKHGEDIDLAVVLLHEFAHGLGMSGSTSVRTGEFDREPGLLVGFPNVWDQHALDLTTGLRWELLTAQQRKDSALNSGNTVWDGPNTRAETNRFLASTTTLIVTAPVSLAGNIDVNTATFGPLPQNRPIAGSIVAAVDAADDLGPTTTDGCTAYTNAAEVAGRIALVDRGTCTFVEKAKIAEAAGAIGLIVVNQEACGLPPMGGEDTTVNIPAIGISRLDGTAIREGLAAGVEGGVRVDASARAGASSGGFMRLYTPCELEVGSSVYHFDTVASPNVLMEPNISDDLKHEVDLTLYQLLDIGWTTPPPAAPPVPSGRRTLRRGRS